MPRMGRVVVPNYPHHVVQRGHNRQVVFASDADCRCYLENLRELRDAFGIRVHAYCLMTNHVHLLLTPGEEVAALGQLMKALAARTTRHRNRLEGRSGTLWESRYRSSPVQTDQYLLACCRYIELNPVRAGMVGEPGAYWWSSYRARMGLARFAGADWLDADPVFRGLASDEEGRRARYYRFVCQAIPEGEWKLIREALQRGQLTGTR